jgi:molecular chaperone DnaK
VIEKILQKTIYHKSRKTVYSIKRFIGKTSQLSKTNSKEFYKVVDNGSNVPSVKIDDRVYTPQEISAMILQKMKKLRKTI